MKNLFLNHKSKILNRRSLTLLLLPVVILGMYFVYRKTKNNEIYATDPLIVTIDGVDVTHGPMFELDDMKPGDTYTQCFTVKNASAANFDVEMEGIKTEEEKDFTKVLLFKIYDQATSNIIFEGKLKDFFSNSPFDLGSFSENDERIFCFDVHFPDDAGNEFQEAYLLFDIKFRSKIGEGIVINEVFYNVDPTHGYDYENNIEAIISCNGDDTSYLIDINILNTCIVVQQNTTYVINDITADSNTGWNTIISSIGDSYIQTGESSIFINLLNELNINIAEDVCCCADDPCSNDEWIEIYNPTSETYNLLGWKIRDNSGTEATIGVSVELGPGEFLLISKSLSTWELWDEDPDAKKVAVGTDIGDGLDDPGDRLYLINPQGATIDYMAWGDDSVIWNPSENPSASEGNSVSRDPNGFDTDLPSDWVSNSSPPTPGY